MADKENLENDIEKEVNQTEKNESMKISFVSSKNILISETELLLHQGQRFLRKLSSFPLN